MLAYLRHHQKSVLLVVTVVVCITFGWFYVKTDTHGGQNAVVFGSIYGKDIHGRDYSHIQKHVEVAMQLQLPGFQDLARGATRESLMPYLASVRMVREEGTKLGLAVTDEEVEAYIQTLPAFLSNGRFDPAKFQLYAGTGPDDGLIIEQFSPYGQPQKAGPFKLSRLGLEIGDLREIIGDYMIYDKMKDLLGAGLGYSATEAAKDYAISKQQLKASVVKFPMSRFKDTVKISDEDIAKAYEAGKARFMTAEKKAIEYIAITAEKQTAPTLPPPPAVAGQPTPPPPAPPAEPKDKMLARRKLADEIYKELGNGKKLAEIAAAKGLAIATTEPFESSAPPEAIKDRNKLQGAVSRITLDRPEPPPVEDGDTWYVLRLTKQIEPEPKPLDQVKETITGEIRDEKSREAAMAAAKELAEKLKPVLATGKSFAEAVTAAGEKAEEIPVIKPVGMDSKPEDRVLTASMRMAKPGSLCEAVNVSDGALLPYLITREIEKSPDQAAATKRMEQGQSNQVRQMVFFEWWTNRLSAANFIDKTRSSKEDVEN